MAKAKHKPRRSFADWIETIFNLSDGMEFAVVFVGVPTLIICACVAACYVIGWFTNYQTTSSTLPPALEAALQAQKSRVAGAPQPSAIGHTQNQGFGHPHTSPYQSGAVWGAEGSPWGSSYELPAQGLNISPDYGVHSYQLTPERKVRMVVER